MLDVEPLILEELERLSPLDESASGDWDRILGKVSQPRSARRVGFRTLLAVAVALAIVVPSSVAFSAGLRNLLGLGQPTPRYDQARLRGEAALPEGYVARIWSAPSKTGGSCMFVTYDRAHSALHPKAMSAEGFCSRVGALPLPPRRRGGIYWSLGTSLGDSYVLGGVANPVLHVSQVTLRWHAGSQQIPTRDGYFIAAVPVVHNPPFKQLPFSLVLTNEGGAQVASYPIPLRFLYFNWKRVEPNLIAYRRAHGCGKNLALWHCRSR